MQLEVVSMNAFEQASGRILESTNTDSRTTSKAILVDDLGIPNQYLRFAGELRASGLMIDIEDRRDCLDVR